MALSSYKYALIAPRLEKILAQNAAPKVPEWQSYGKFRKVTQYAHFLKKILAHKAAPNVPEWASYGNSCQITQTRIF